MDRFEQMRIFATVVETGSMTAAAGQLRVAKSAVSRRIAELEERLGVQLFRRTTRRLNLTDSGRGFYDRCRRILADLDEAEEAVARAHTELRGNLRIAVPQTFGLMHLSPAIRDFAGIHPQVEFDLDFNDREVDLVRDGFDLGVRIARLQDSTLAARRLAPIRSTACASPAYLEAHGAPEQPADLQTHACLVYSNIPEQEVWRYRSPAGDTGTVKLNVRLKANSGDFLTQMAIAGQGIVLEPNFIVYQAIQRGELVPILTGYRWPEISAYAVYPQTRLLSRRVRTFVDFLVERFAGVPYWDDGLPA
ncbi:MAG: LysR family transcriptional regulator [Pseudomonadota bacterium]